MFIDHKKHKVLMKDEEYQVVPRIHEDKLTDNQLEQQRLLKLKIDETHKAEILNIKIGRIFKQELEAIAKEQGISLSDMVYNTLKKIVLSHKVGDDIGLQLPPKFHEIETFDED